MIIVRIYEASSLDEDQTITRQLGLFLPSEKEIPNQKVEDQMYVN